MVRWTCCGQGRSCCCLCDGGPFGEGVKIWVKIFDRCFLLNEGRRITSTLSAPSHFRVLLALRCCHVSCITQHLGLAGRGLRWRTNKVHWRTTRRRRRWHSRELLILLRIPIHRRLRRRLQRHHHNHPRPRQPRTHKGAQNLPQLRRQQERHPQLRLRTKR
mgnify:CR=1 FL=1